MDDRNYGYAEPQTDEEVRPLESLSSIADDAERTAILISAFIIRFRHGSSAGQSGDNAAAKLSPVPSGHAGQINRLSDAVCQLDKLARDLNTLG